MIALLLALQSPAPPPPPVWYSGRILTVDGLHVGARLHVLADREEMAIGVTIQVSGHVL